MHTVCTNALYGINRLGGKRKEQPAFPRPPTANIAGAAGGKANDLREGEKKDANQPTIDDLISKQEGKKKEIKYGDLKCIPTE
jgi:hypothetical protein